MTVTTMKGYKTKLASIRVAFCIVSMHYLNTTCLVHKIRFVAVFLRNKRCNGYVTTPRVKIAQAALEKWIYVPVGKMFVDSALIFVISRLFLIHCIPSIISVCNDLLECIGQLAAI